MTFTAITRQVFQKCENYTRTFFAVTSERLKDVSIYFQNKRVVQRGSTVVQ